MVLNKEAKRALSRVRLAPYSKTKVAVLKSEYEVVVIKEKKQGEETRSAHLHMYKLLRAATITAYQTIGTYALSAIIYGPHVH